MQSTFHNKLQGFITNIVTTHLSTMYNSSIRYSGNPVTQRKLSKNQNNSSERAVNKSSCAWVSTVISHLFPGKYNKCNCHITLEFWVVSHLKINLKSCIALKCRPKRSSNKTRIRHIHINTFANLVKKGTKSGFHIVIIIMGFIPDSRYTEVQFLLEKQAQILS